MKKRNPNVAKNASELADILGLSPADGLEIEIRSDLKTRLSKRSKRRS
jgi:hypothetical protein